MKDKDSIRGRKLPDVSELYDVEGKNGVHFWSYAYMEIMNELYLNLNYYLAGEGEEFFANARIVCSDVSLECNLLDLCIMIADEAPKLPQKKAKYGYYK